ncbi:arylacetamide deacetylase-like 4 [Plakobranchus ocellatus]|uniref:Arylacetamide deacetylase-like 4 n=1 Tax=Plakobranchus ocellatus TaxID=259542 RepID=A0AAV4BDM8_9GAST|nr:arylacetamide deacetylase-like 4 [Plakobranchus ocellatus]
MTSSSYRKAPKHPFPAGVHDCVNVTTHLLKEGHKYGIDVNRIGVAGDSAGGNLAAVVALQVGEIKRRGSDSQRKDTLPSLKYQALFYPLLQAVDFWLPSYVYNNDVTPSLLNRNFITYLLAMYFGLGSSNATHYGNIMAKGGHIPLHVREEYSKHVNRSRLFVNQIPGAPSSGRENPASQNGYQQGKSRDSLDPYATVPAGSKGVTVDWETHNLLAHQISDPMFSPLFSTNVSQAPPTFLHVAEFDVLRDEGLLYAQKLRAAGVHVVTFYSIGGVHGEITKHGFSLLEFKRGDVALQKMFSFVNETLRAL